MKPTAVNLKHVQFWPHCARQNGSDLIMQGCKIGHTFAVFKTTCFTNQSQTEKLMNTLGLLEIWAVLHT